MYWSFGGIWCLYFNGIPGLKAQAVFCFILVSIEKGQPSLAKTFIVASLYFNI